jgi:hypothetical protein
VHPRGSGPLGSGRHPALRGPWRHTPHAPRAHAARPLALRPSQWPQGARGGDRGGTSTRGAARATPRQRHTHGLQGARLRNRNGPARPPAASRCGRPVRRASTRRASGGGARCKKDRDSTTEGAVRAGCGTVGRVTGEAGCMQSTCSSVRASQARPSSSRESCPPGGCGGQDQAQCVYRSGQQADRTPSASAGWEGGRVARAAVLVLLRSRRPAGGTRMGQTACKLRQRRLEGGRVVPAARRMLVPPRSRRAGGGTRTGRKARASASAGWGGRSRRASGTARARPAAIVRHVLRHTISLNFIRSSTAAS